MAEYIHIDEQENCISITLDIEQDKIMAIGEKLNEINEEAYMNGYNWEALFRCYLEQNAPELLEDFDADSEAGMYAGYYYEVSDENKEKAHKFAKMIEALIEDEEKLYQFVREYGEEIEWD